jgi:hypothetical protein
VIRLLKKAMGRYLKEVTMEWGGSSLPYLRTPASSSDLELVVGDRFFAYALYKDDIDVDKV